MPGKKLSKKLQEETERFFESTPASRLGRNLRSMFMAYLVAYEDGHGFELSDLLIDLSALFELLDVAEDEPK